MGTRRLGHRTFYHPIAGHTPNRQSNRVEYALTAAHPPRRDP